VPFAWNLHLAHPIDSTSRVYIAADAMHAVPSQAGRFVGRNTPLGWPTDGDVDMTAVLPPESGVTEWLHAAGLREGWCAVIHPSRGVGLEITFNRDVFHTV
jgi:hypothetical protein